MSEKLIAESKADNGRASNNQALSWRDRCSLSHLAFDPKPFIRSFEAAVDKLIAVRKEVQAQTERMEKTVRVTEREYSKKMADLTKGFEVGVLIMQ